MTDVEADFTTDWPKGVSVAVVPLDRRRKQFGVKVMDVRHPKLVRSITLHPGEWRQVLAAIRDYLPLAERPGQPLDEVVSHGQP